MDVEQFQQAMAKLPEPVTELKPPYWEHWRHDLWTRAQQQDPRRFEEWPCVHHTMLVNHWVEPIHFEYGALDRQLLSACRVPHFGPDDPLPHTGYSMNLIHQAYHLQQWEQAAGQRINRLETIVEFGGGYGAMALLCHRLGFEGRYVIYDLPEFALLQEYYLSHFGVLDKVTWNPKREPKDVDLFMALYSLSEVEWTERPKLIIQAKSYLCLYSGQWEQWNNIEWFQDGLPKIAQYVKNWQHTELTHLPDRFNYYSIGF